MMVTFRPHHFLCALCFRGKGYSDAFTTNFQSLMLDLTQNPKTEITVTHESDSICAPCPNRIDKFCSTETKINHLDNLHSKHLGFQPGQRYTWQDAKQQIANKLNLNLFHQICATCSWKGYGICENVIKTFLAREKS